MTDADDHTGSEADHERFDHPRIQAVTRWVEYIESNSPEVWGPQQNAIVEEPLDATRRAAVSATDRQQAQDVAADIIAERDERDKTE